MPSIVSPGLRTRHVDGHVGLGARVRLDVDVFGAEELLRAIDGERLGDVDELAAAVIPPARIPLGVFVRHHAAGGFEHGEADEVLGRDELEAFFLTADFVADGRGDIGIDVRRDGSFGVRRVGVERGDLVEAPLMAAARKRRVEEELDESPGDDRPA